jgi:2-iminobutanoate/2-iminopropanoate deaminase
MLRSPFSAPFGGFTTRGVQNLERMEEAAGLTMSHIVKTTVYLQDMSLFGSMNAVYATFFEGDYPARAAFAVKALPKESGIHIVHAGK